MTTTATTILLDSMPGHSPDVRKWLWELPHKEFDSVWVSVVLTALEEDGVGSASRILCDVRARYRRAMRYEPVHAGGKARYLLNDTQKRIIRRIQGLSLLEIGDSFGLSQWTVKRFLQREVRNGYILDVN